MRRAFMKKNPQALWVEYAPLANTNERKAMLHAFGGNWMPVYDFSQAKAILSIDADFLGAGPLQVPNTRGWAEGRKVDHGTMSRLWMVESGLSVTGSKVDERQAMRPADILALLQDEQISLQGAGTLTEEQVQWAEKMKDDLNKAGNHVLVIAGASQPPIVHYLTARLNELLGSVGTTVSYRQVDDGSTATIEDAVAGIKDGSIKGAIIIDGNPAYDAPSELDFATALKALPISVHLSYYNNETSQACKWHINKSNL